MDSSPDTSQPRSRGLLFFDGLALVVLALAAARWRLNCVPLGQVFGDAYMALECAFHLSSGDWWISPSQPIYGHGLCLSYAPLFLGADSLFEVASRRALVGAMVVPAYYLVGVTAATRLFRANAHAARLAGLLVGLLAWRSELLHQMGTQGSLGYFAPLLTLLIGLGLLRATTGRAPFAAVAAFALVPLAMMNHPFTLWLVPAVLVLLPAIIRRSGLPAGLVAVAAMVVCSVPRTLQLARLIEGNGLVEGIKQIADPGSVPDDVWQQLWPMIFDPANLPIVAGLLLLVSSPWLLRKALPEEFTREHRLWAVAAGMSLVLTVAVGIALGYAGNDPNRHVSYLRYYHLMFLHPFAVTGLAGGLALGFGWLWFGSARSEGPFLRSPLRVLASLGLVTLCLAPAFVRAGTPLTEACNEGVPHTKEAGGCRDVADAIIADSPPGRITIDNLTGPEGGSDSSVSVVLDLLVRGMDPQLLYAPQSVEPMTWYWILSTHQVTGLEGENIDFTALASQVDDVEVLLDLQRSSELVLVVRSETGRLKFGELLCSTLSPGMQLWGRTYKTWISQLLRPGDHIQYPEPYAPCLARRIIE